MTPASVTGRISELRDEIGKVVYGQTAVIDQMIITLLCGGHALLEGVPGTAKTLAVRALAAALSCGSKRIQFTPDLMPSDIVGTSVFNMRDSVFELRKGPIFTDLLLADEINRAPTKTQSALLEAMSELQVTIDGDRHRLSPVFTVFATQNPIEFEGTYPLPEAQKDRFLVKINVGYPDETVEMAVVEAFNRGDRLHKEVLDTVRPVATIDDLQAFQKVLHTMNVEQSILSYILKITRSTRGHESITVGAGPRGTICLLQASKARALLRGRDFVTPDDVVTMVEPVLAHRVILTADAEIQGARVEQVLRSILDGIQVPR